MKATQTFEYSGDHEWASWREGVLCAECDTWDRTKTVAIGLHYGVYNNGGLGEVHVTPVCDKHADNNVIRFDRGDN